jgi:hypothetical protein
MRGLRSWYTLLRIDKIIIEKTTAHVQDDRGPTAHVQDDRGPSAHVCSEFGAFSIASTSTVLNLESWPF